MATKIYADTARVVGFTPMTELHMRFRGGGEDMMHCCGHALTRRGWMWSAMLSSVGSVFAGCAGTRADGVGASAEPLTAAALLRDNISIDVHTHAGPNGVTSRTA